VDLRGNGSLSDAALALDQDGEIAIGNPRNRGLDLHVDLTGRLRLSLCELDSCSAWHEGSWVLAFTGSNPGTKTGLRVWKSISTEDAHTLSHFGAVRSHGNGNLFLFFWRSLAHLLPIVVENVFHA
jgi:hypothetical protein